MSPLKQSKALRGSLDRFEGRRATQVLSAIAFGKRIVLSQILSLDACKAREIQPAQQHTLDALHLQKTVEAVITTGSDLLVHIKGNHPKLLATVAEVCRTQDCAEWIGSPAASSAGGSRPP